MKEALSEKTILCYVFFIAQQEWGYKCFSALRVSPREEKSWGKNKKSMKKSREAGKSQQRYKAA